MSAPPPAQPPDLALELTVEQTQPMPLSGSVRCEAG